MAKKSGLGRGLASLIPVSQDVDDPRDHYEELSLNLLDPNPEQPRQTFHEEQLQELADSIRHNGVIQPIIVTAREGRYLVIAGERRWRATKLAGFEKIPAIVRKVEPDQMLSLALLENIQRQELNPIEEALAYQKLLETHQFTHENLASNLGKSRVSITNTVRLLKLPDRIKNLIQDEKLSFGHARCLITIDDPQRLDHLAAQCIAKGWSVRELEKKCQQERAAKRNKKRTGKSETLKGWERALGERVRAKVTIAGDAKKGKIAITYGSESELRQIVASILNHQSGE